MIVSCSLQEPSVKKKKSLGKQKKQKAGGLSFTAFVLSASGQQMFRSLTSSVDYYLC